MGGAMGEGVAVFDYFFKNRHQTAVVVFFFRITFDHTPPPHPPPVLLSLMPPERLQPITWGHRRAGFKADKCI